MKYHQQDIVEVSFMFPDGTFKPHPALIVSNDELQEDEGFIYLCMISSKAYNSQYNYTLTNEMLTKPLMKQSFVKCQLLVGNIERDVIRKISTLKQPYFNEVVEQIKRTIF
ncbi:MAG: type II toxin-antitoxin system PemK/MazF family toxin [Bacteroidales bacterium]|nr:type II toxin-antitoxin system PemK/MazF family toxin [Bacteroidales bacterium]